MSRYQQVSSDAVTTPVPSQIRRKPVQRENEALRGSFRQYDAAAADENEDDTIQLRPLSFHQPPTSSSAGERSSSATPGPHHTSPLEGRRYRPWESISVLGLLTLVGGACLIFIACSFLVFLWIGAQEARSSQGRPPAFWTDLVHRGWAPTTVTICAAALRTAISLQTGLLAASLAAVVLETKGTRLQDVAVLSMSRAWKSSPLDVTPAILRRSKATGPVGILYALVITASCFIALASTFISTVLLSDFELSPVASPSSAENPRIGLSFENNLDYFDISENLIGTSTWQASAAEYWRFAEHREGDSEAGDTGDTYLALLPYRDVLSRISLEEYAGPAMVVNAHTICTALPEMSIEIAYEHDIKSGMEDRITFNAKGGDREYKCQLVTTGDLPIDENILTAATDWPISICPQARTDSNFDDLPKESKIRRKLEMKDSKLPAYKGTSRWGGFLLLNTTQKDIDQKMNEAIYGNKTRGGSDRKQPWDTLTLKPEEDLWSTVYDADDKAVVKASMCWHTIQAPEAFDVKMSGKPISAEPVWRRSGDNNDIQRQLGIGIAHDDFDGRGILKLDIGDRKPRDRDLENNQRDLQEWYLMGFEAVLGELPKASNVGWSLARAGLMSTHISHTTVFQSIVQKTKDPAIAVQALLSRLYRMHYYEIMDMFELQYDVTTVRSTETLVPVRWTGLIAVLVLTVVHLILVFTTVTLFILKTEVSALGNTWQTVAQIARATRQVPGARRTLDKEVETWAKAKGRDKEIWALGHGRSDDGEERVEVRLRGGGKETI